MNRVNAYRVESFMMYYRPNCSRWGENAGSCGLCDREFGVTLLQRIIDDLLDADMIPVMTNYIEIMCIFLKHYDSQSFIATRG